MASFCILLMIAAHYWFDYCKVDGKFANSTNIFSRFSKYYCLIQHCLHLKGSYLGKLRNTTQL